MDEGLKPLSVLVPVSTYKNIEKLIKRGAYVSKAELVREALRDVLKKHGIAEGGEDSD